MEGFNLTVKFTDQPYERIKEAPKGVPMCDFCFRSFKTFTLLYKHKARPCFEERQAEEPYPIKISMDASHLSYIGDAIAALGLNLQVCVGIFHRITFCNRKKVMEENR